MEFGGFLLHVPVIFNCPQRLFKKPVALLKLLKSRIASSTKTKADVIHHRQEPHPKPPTRRAIQAAGSPTLCRSAVHKQISTSLLFLYICLSSLYLLSSLASAYIVNICLFSFIPICILYVCLCFYICLYFPIWEAKKRFPFCFAGPGHTVSKSAIDLYGLLRSLYGLQSLRV